MNLVQPGRLHCPLCDRKLIVGVKQQLFEFQITHPIVVTTATELSGGESE